MALKEYEVSIAGMKHTLQLSDEDAKKYKGAKEIKRPANKQAAAPANKDASASDTK